MFHIKSWRGFAMGGLLGFFVIHPIIMISAQAMTGSGSGSFESMRSSGRLAFSYMMLPWSLGFAGLSGLIGWQLIRIRSALIKEKKLQGAMELAGAACHELNQPMQVVLGYAELISKELTCENHLDGHLEEIIAQIVRMDRILRRIRTITRYETCEYIEGAQIIDIYKASGACTDARNHPGKA